MMDMWLFSESKLRTKFDTIQTPKRMYNKNVKGDSHEQKNDAGGIAAGQRGGGCFRNRF